MKKKKSRYTLEIKNPVVMKLSRNPNFEKMDFSTGGKFLYNDSKKYLFIEKKSQEQVESDYPSAKFVEQRKGSVNNGIMRKKMRSVS